GRFVRSGGPVRRSSLSSSNSSNSSRHVGLIASSFGLPCVHSASTRRRQSQCSSVSKFFQNVSRFTAQKCDVAMVVDSRQIHPNSQLPRPDFTGGVIRLPAHG